MIIILNAYISVQGADGVFRLGLNCRRYIDARLRIICGSVFYLKQPWSIKVRFTGKAKHNLTKCHLFFAHEIDLRQ